jgi:carboxylesterase type B
VTIWGESSGSISVLDQMALYNRNNTYKGARLFRAAVMDSGSIVPADPVNCTKGQVVYNTVAKNAGCVQSNDTLACLRAAPYDTFPKAANSVPRILSFNSIALFYLPRPDGVTLTQSPEILVKEGKFAQVPFIISDQEDEGTIFALQQTNLTTTADVVNYLSTIFFNDANTTQVQQLVPKSRNGTCLRRPVVYGQKPGPASSTIQAYYVSFFNTMDPNGAAGLMPWPTWAQGNQLMNFTASGGTTLIPNTFRNESFAVLVANQASFHI